ncbi:hypothetical protein [Nonomuraea turkmeniaca]|nr:hypothetical protein [Nonomuraea turkmeniaca]
MRPNRVVMSKKPDERTSTHPVCTPALLNAPVTRQYTIAVGTQGRPPV